MGFRFGYPVLIPSELDGKYLLPYSWLKYGLQQGYISVIDKRFYDTVQGSMMLFMDDIITRNPELTTSWLLYQGEGLISLVKAPYINGTFGEIPIGNYNNLPISLQPWYTVYAFDGPNNSKSLSHALFQLVRGCGLHLNQSVWDVPYDPLQDSAKWNEWTGKFKDAPINDWYYLEDVRGKISRLNDVLK